MPIVTNTVHTHITLRTCLARFSNYHDPVDRKEKSILCDFRAGTRGSQVLQFSFHSLPNFNCYSLRDFLRLGFYQILISYQFVLLCSHMISVFIHFLKPPILLSNCLFTLLHWAVNPQQVSLIQFPFLTIIGTCALDEKGALADTIIKCLSDDPSCQKIKKSLYLLHIQNSLGFDSRDSKYNNPKQVLRFVPVKVVLCRSVGKENKFILIFKLRIGHVLVRFFNGKFEFSFG